MTDVTVTDVLAWQDAASRAFVPLLCTAPEPVSSPISSPFPCPAGYLWRASSRGLSGWSVPNDWPAGMMAMTFSCHCSCSRPGLSNNMGGLLSWFLERLPFTR